MYFLHFIATTPQIYSALDRFNLELCKSLSLKGWKPVFIYLDRVEPIQLTNDLQKANGIIEILDTGKSKFELFLQIVRLYKKYRPKKVSTHFVNYIRLWNAVLTIVFKADNYNIFHSMFFGEDLADYKKRKGYLKYFFIKSYLKITIFRSNKVICISKAISNQLYEITDFYSKKIAVSYVGLKALQQHSYNKNIIRRTFNLPSDKILIANIGAFEKLKGIEIIVKSLSLLVHEFDCKGFAAYHIGGNRKDDDKSKQYNRFVFTMCKNFNINEYIFFMGKRNDVPALLPAFDIYIHPSLSEGLGSAIVEAISAGLPIIATNTGGIPEVVHHEKNGYLIAIDDSRALAVYLKELIENKENRNKLGRNGYSYFVRTFQISHTVNNALKQYGIF